MPGAESFASAASPEHPDVGVLLVHGLTSTPQTMGPLSEHLARLGYAVRCPRLPGHGTRVQDMRITRYADWLARVETEAVALQREHGRVVAAGISLGGALVTDLAAQRPDLVDALVVINPGFASDDQRLALLPLLKLLTPTFPGLADQIRRSGPPRELAYDRLPLHAFHSFVQRWKGLRRDFAKVAAPILLLRSAHDELVPARSARLFLDGVGSTDVTEVWLRDSGHVAVLDHDQPQVLQETADFVARIERMSA